MLKTVYFSYCIHVSTVLKICALRLHLLRLLRNEGLSRLNLSIVFHSIILSTIAYCLPVWGGYLTADQRGQINSFFKRNLSKLTDL